MRLQLAASDVPDHLRAYFTPIGPCGQCYVCHLVEVFAQLHRVLHPSGTVWLNLGDSFANDTKWGGHGSGPDSKNYTSGLGGYAGQKQRRSTGLKPKDLMLLPHRVAIALQEWGWWIRSTIVWSKSNPMPESITDRPTQSHEYVFLLTKSARYFYDADAIREPMASSSIQRLTQPTFDQQQGGPKDYSNGTHPSRSARKALNNRHEKLVKQEKWQARHEGWAEWDTSAGRNKRSVWTMATQPCADAHFATFPEELITPMVLAGTSEAGCCRACRAPYRRVMERTGHVNGREAAHQPGNTPTKTDSTGWAPTTRATEEWQAGCSCDAGPPIGCTVMDIFCGSGTTGVVAKRYGRNFIGIELNESYCTLSEKRIAGVCEPLFTAATLGSSSAGAAR